jgi:hypothetical protein
MMLWAREHFGLGAALLTLLAFCAGLVATSVPTGPPRVVDGVIASLGFAETERGSEPYADVLVDGRSARVGLARGSLCRTGDRVALTRQRAGVGERYALAPPGCTRP